MTVSGLFINAGVQRQLAPGDVVFAEGDPGEEMYGVVDGEIELTAAGRTIATLGAGEVFGEMALVDAGDRMATATATAPTTIAAIDRRHFLFLVHETPTFALQVMSTMADRLRHRT